MEKEIWKSIVGLERYEVSNYGRLRNAKSHYVLRSHINGDTGYLRITLRKDGVRHHPLVHNLVTEAFIGPRPRGSDIDHINGLTIDNRLSNLRYLKTELNRGCFISAKRRPDIIVYNENDGGVKFVPFTNAVKKIYARHLRYLSFYLRLYGYVYLPDKRLWLFAEK